MCVMGHLCGSKIARCNQQQSEETLECLNDTRPGVGAGEGLLEQMMPEASKATSGKELEQAISSSRNKHVRG